MPSSLKRAMVTIAASPIASASAPPADPSRPKTWWERRAFVAVLIAISTIPLIYPDVPPLVDLFGHMGRYRIELDLDSSPWLQQFYDYRWSAIGNLGVDLLVIPLSAIFGLELAVKLIVLTIPPMTVAGLLWVAREVHHRLPPTALFALPFAFGFPFLFGFANFPLAMAFALLAFGLWLRLGRLDRDRLRALLFVPISVIVFFTHAFGWGMLGLLCFSAEAVRIHDRGQRWFKAGAIAAAHAAVMGLPIAFMALWRGGTSRQLTFGWFEWSWKWEWIYSALRDRWQWFDIGALVVIALVFLYSLVDRRLVLSRNLAFSALVLLAAFLLLPWTIFGSAYADMRIVPYLLAVAVLAIRFRSETDRRLAGTLAAAGLALYAARIAGTTLSLGIAADDQQAKLQALAHVPMGAPLVTLTGQPCRRPWALPRNSHLGAMAIVRRHAFSNDQWAIEGANLLQVKFEAAGHFMADPSQLVRPAHCPTDQLLSVNQALSAIPRDAFDYVWTIDIPPHDPQSLRGMRAVWRGPGSALYRIEKTGSWLPQ